MPLPCEAIVSAGELMPRRLRIGWPTLPAWLAALPVGQVTEIANSKLSAAAYSHPGGFQGYGATAVVNSWGSTAYDYTRNRFWSGGGGHTDYNGNEFYVLDLLASSLTWAVGANPSATLPATNSNDTYGDGLLASSHMYNNLVYAESVDRVMVIGLGSRFDGGANGASVFALNPANGTWDSAATWPAVPGAEANTQGGAAAYDHSRQCIWYKQFNTNQLRRLDLATKTWSSYGDGELQKQDATLCYDPVRDCLLSLGGAGNTGTQGGGSTQITVWDLASISGSSLTSTGSLTCTGFPGGTQWGHVFDLRTSKHLLFHDSNTYYEVTPTGGITAANWSASSVVMSGATAPNAANMGNGTYGRWKIANINGTYVGLWNGADTVDSAHPDTNMFAYRFN